jgi:hypothetical protein
MKTKVTPMRKEQHSGASLSSLKILNFVSKQNIILFIFSANDLFMRRLFPIDSFNQKMPLLFFVEQLKYNVGQKRLKLY